MNDEYGSNPINRLEWHRLSGRFIDTTPYEFHGYTVIHTGVVLGKNDLPLTLVKRERRGGGFDWCVRLSYNGKQKKWTLSRLMGSCFLGNIDGMEMNHDDRNPSNCNIFNMNIDTRSANQKHWREDEQADC